MSPTPSAGRPAPLVEPGPPLGTDEIARYARHLLVPDVGELGQRRLAAARVLVLGAGGLGSPVLLYLAAAGIGTIGVCDADVVDASNLQRQVVHGVSDVGRPKVGSAAATLAEINPLVTVVQHPVRLDASNALQLVADYDLVVDGTDNFATRYLVNDACALLAVPVVWGSVYRFDGQASVWWAGHGPCYRCVFPVPPPAGSVPSCAEGGVLGVLCGAIGAVQATEVVKLVTGIGESLVGRLLVHDALRAGWAELPVRADPGCAVCGPSATITLESGLADYDAFCGVPADAASSAQDDDLRVVGALELRDWLADPERDIVLVDVREPGERAIVSIPGAIAVPRQDFDSGEAFDRLPFDRPVVLHCKGGGRSASALRLLVDAGHPDARHLAGGVLAWVQQVDPALPTY
ncbi:MAG TPA: molybdopterin-synthase adenylyltransferase MoeB [Actinomycetales bacterium]|jgi:adenylyltransferase/sulfurtransferase